MMLDTTEGHTRSHRATCPRGWLVTM